MERRNNYAIQASAARKLFLSYDQEGLIRKLGLKAEAGWLYTRFFDCPYRINRLNGSMERFCGDAWQKANSFNEVLTLMDLICDSREDRFLTGRWKNLTDFGNQFHRNLLEEGVDPFAARIQEEKADFVRACEKMGGRAIKGADISYAIPAFQELSIALFFWEGDEEFAPRVRYLWDENALMYLKYETMYYAVDFLKERLRSCMEGEPLR